MTTAAPTLLDPLRFVLRGSALVEASAGTGKTFTIAALYLRLVLGHGGDAAFARPLDPPEILVVTFTEAATKELRDRIRARLAEAAQAFEGGDVDDPLLRALRAGYPAPEWPACTQKLRLAAEWMDEAAVSTIHGWCNRMLREHAFDSGSLFEQALEADQAELEEEAVRDYWRTFFYPLPAQDAQCVAGWWATPGALRSELRGLLAHVDRLPAAPPPGITLQETREARAAQLAELRRPWASWCGELQHLLDAAVAAGQVNGTRLKKVHYDAWLQHLRDWCAGTHDTPWASDSARKRLTRAGLREAWRRPEEAPGHPALEALESLGERLACLPECRDQVLAHAAAWVKDRMAAEQHRRAEMGFDDLLAQLHRALQGKDSGPRLAARIREQFPAALIDEFQDTDPVQYGIFRSIYAPAEAREDTALVLIGDPKQAIYAFRGADIHTYLAARRETAGRHATLGTNFRSADAMVRAVNHLFVQAEQRPAGEGAFLFRGRDDNPLPFFPVAAQGRTQRWQVEGRDAAALTCWWIDPGHTVGVKACRERLAAACATEVVRLLQLARQGLAGFAEDGRPLQAISPRDIAVLVNDRNEARAVRDALRERGVGSVYLSDQDNVYRSPAAGELQRLLQACAAPEDGALVRAALGTALLAQDWQALDRLNHDEIHWEKQLERFRGYRQCWQHQGVLPMLRHLLHDFRVPQRLIAAGEERLLTDLLHLAELLQQASVLVEGEHALLRHLAEQREEGAPAVDNRQLRLESDADLLKVVTVHKSKGLEYPLVFVPFACASRPVKPQDLPLRWHDEEGRLQLSLRPDEALAALADRERLGEDLRKLYVALTRARFATWIAVAPTPELERSALGYLLTGGEALGAGQVQATLAAAWGGCDAIEVAPAPEPSGAQYVAPAPPSQLAPLPPLPKEAREHWWIASYSRLRAVAGTPARAAPVAQSAQEENWLEGALEDGAGSAAVKAAAGAGALRGAVGAGLSPGASGVRLSPGAAGSGLLPGAAAARPLTDAVGAEPLRGADGAGPQAGTAGAEPLSAVAVASPGGALHDFPRGPSPGSFLHGVLEWAGREGFAAVAAPRTIEDMLARRCRTEPWARHREALARWLTDWLATPLDLRRLVPDASPVAPSALAAIQPELEFWLATSGVDAQALDRVVTAHTLQGVPRAPIVPQQLNGMLKGFMDLVFEHEGRYYVADYKSNWLGPADASYSVAAMRDEVLHHRYELQYSLYLFALHRLLRSRLPDYDYERHVGGAVYVFLRGHAAPSQGLHLERPPAALMEALDRLFTVKDAA